jgi:hypothetical protein
MATEGSRTEDQHGSPLVDRATVNAFAPDEERLILHPPPLLTVAEDAAHNPEYWRDLGCLDQIHPDEAVLLGDFGSGSETVLIADFRTDPAQVLRRALAEGGDQWTHVAGTVEELLELLGVL